MKLATAMLALVFGACAHAPKSQVPVRASLQVEDLLKTPISTKYIKIFYEVDDHPDVKKEWMEPALEYVADFFATYKVHINFQPVEKLHHTMFDKVNTFGLHYTSPEQVYFDMLDISGDPDEETIQLIKERLEEFSTNGYGSAQDGLAVVATDKDTITHFEHDADKARWLKTQGLAYEGMVPDDLDVRYFAGRIAHEVGHIIGLVHSFNCENDSMPDTINGVPNIMAYQNPEPHVTKAAVSSTFSRENPLGQTLSPFQVALMHNYLSEGVVFRTVQASEELYERELESANGFTNCSYE